jgi:hypothetical protein
MKFAGRFLCSPFRSHLSIANEHKAKQNYQAGTCGAHWKQWMLPQSPSCQRRGNWPTAYRPTIYNLYLVENQTTTAKASHDSRLPRVLFEEKEERFPIPTRMCWWDVQNNFWAAKGVLHALLKPEQNYSDACSSTAPKTGGNLVEQGTGIKTKMQLQRGSSQCSNVHVTTVQV